LSVAVNAVKTDKRTRSPSNLRPITRECVQLRVVTFGHMTKMAVTPFDPP